MVSIMLILLLCIQPKHYCYNRVCSVIHNSGILKDFDTHFVQKGLYSEYESFKDAVLKMNDEAPSEAFANNYLQQARDFAAFAKQFREQAVLAEK